MATTETSLTSSPISAETQRRLSATPTQGTEDLELPGLPDELWDELRSEGGNGRWTTTDRVRAALVYSTVGGSKRTEAITGVPEETVRHWKNYAPWWNKVVHHVHKFNNQKHIASLTQTILAAGEELADRVKNGEYVYDKEGNMCLDANGVPKRRKLTAHSLAVDGIAIPGQRRALLLGDPTSRQETSGVETMRELKELFQTIGIKRVKNITPEPLVIDQAD